MLKKKVPKSRVILIVGILLMLLAGTSAYCIKTGVISLPGFSVPKISKEQEKPPDDDYGRDFEIEAETESETEEETETDTSEYENDLRFNTPREDAMTNNKVITQDIKPIEVSDKTESDNKQSDDEHTHKFGTPTYSWDGKKCVAKRVCDCGETETEIVTSITLSVDPTCILKGIIKNVATFENKAFESQETSKDIEAKGHNFGTPTYTWNGSECVAKRVCLNDDNHIETEIATITTSLTEQSCFEDGEMTYTATFTNKAFKSQVKTVVVPAYNEHDIKHGRCTRCPYKLEAGLYDANGIMLCSWKDSGIDNTCSNATEIIANNYPTTDLVVISDEVEGIAEDAFVGKNPFSTDDTYSPSSPSVNPSAYINITDVVLPDNIVIAPFAFRFCNLKELKIPDNCTLYYYNFPMCNIDKIIVSNTTNIFMPNLGTYGIVENEDIDFSDVVCAFAFTNLGEIVMEGEPINFCIENNIIYNIGKTEILSYPVNKKFPTELIPNTVTSIGTFAFMGNFCTEELVLSDTITNIKDRAFGYCGSPAIILPDSITKIGEEAFYGSLIKSIEIPQGVTEIKRQTFDNCEYLTNVIIPNTVTSIGNHAFYNCISLESIAIPDSVTDIKNNAFSNCYSLKEITIPQGVTEIKSSTFYNCKNLSNVTLHDAIIGIGDSAFAYCASLKEITIPDSVEYIGEKAFMECSNLETVKLPNNLTTINKRTFLNCSSLKNITIPETVTSIGYLAFDGCENIESLTIPDTVTYIDWDAFRKVQHTYFNGTVDENSGHAPWGALAMN